jgi:hypothetical protein
MFCEAAKKKEGKKIERFNAAVNIAEICGIFRV